MKTALLVLVTLAAPAFAQDAPPPPRPGGAMMRADTNGDGIVTRQEALAQAGERFDRMDANHDGKLTQDEMAQVGGRVRGMRGDYGAPPPPGDRPAPRQ